MSSTAPMLPLGDWLPAVPERPHSFTVVLPTHDRPQLLRRAIDSVVAQSRDDWELVVVNDGTVSLMHLISLYARNNKISFRSTRGNEGASVARNIGLRDASGGFISFLDDDDELEVDFLAEAGAELERSGCDFLWTGRVHIDQPKQKTTTKIWNSADVHADLAFVTDVATSCGLTLRHACLRHSGGFDQALRTSEDRDLILRLLDLGMRYSVVAKPLVRVYNEGVQSLSRLRKCPDRSLLSAQDDEVVIRRHRKVIYGDRRLTRRYLEGLAGKYYDAGSPAGFWNVFRRCLSNRVLSFRLFRRAVKVVFKAIF